MRFSVFAFIAFLFSFSAFAQTAVKTNPTPWPGQGQTSGQIAVTNTFQVAVPYNHDRRGGLIQNNGANFMFVFFNGAATDCTGATTAKSFQLQPPTTTTQGGSLSFGANGIAFPDEVCITGTGADVFVYVQQ